MLICDLIGNQATMSAEPQQTVLEIARMMVEHNIGAVPVLRNGQLVGIFSERDLMSRVVVKGRDPGNTPVSQVMTEDPLTVGPKDPLETCMTLMRIMPVATTTPAISFPPTQPTIFRLAGDNILALT